MISEIHGCHPGSLVHELVCQQGIIADDIDLVTIRKMDNIVNGDIPVKQAGMCVVVMILAIEKVAAAALRVKVPKQYAKPTFSQVTGYVDRSSGFADTSFDIIYGNFFQ
jgi:hypothetical protein